MSIYPTHHASDRLVSATAAVLAGYALLSTGAFGSWVGIGVVGLLMAVVEEDVRHRRIPNRITFLGFALALVHATWTAGPDGLLSALAGAAVGLAVLVLPFSLRFLGAGDVKAVMALGAFFGPALLLGQLWWITVIGGVFALFTRLTIHVGLSARSTAATGIPFGVAIALGVAAHQIWGLTWLS